VITTAPNESTNAGRDVQAGRGTLGPKKFMPKKLATNEIGMKDN